MLRVLIQRQKEFGSCFCRNYLQLRSYATERLPEPKAFTQKTYRRSIDEEKTTTYGWAMLV